MAIMIREWKIQIEKYRYLESMQTEDWGCEM